MVTLEPCRFVTEATAAFDRICGQPACHSLVVYGRMPIRGCCLHIAALMLLLMATRNNFLEVTMSPHPDEPDEPWLGASAN